MSTEMHAVVKMLKVLIPPWRYGCLCTGTVMQQSVYFCNPELNRFWYLCSL